MATWPRWRGGVALHANNDGNKLGEVVHVVGSAPRRKHSGPGDRCSPPTGCRDWGMPSHAAKCSRSCLYERTMSRKKTSVKLRVLCWNHELCLIDVEAEHAKADVIIQHRNRKPSLRLVPMHQDIWDLHLQHNILLGISPTSLKNWMPRSGSLNRNARNNLLVTPLALSIAEGTYGLELGCRRFVSKTEVTRISKVLEL
jgi:hypothetical protein